MSIKRLIGDLESTLFERSKWLDQDVREHAKFLAVLKRVLLSFLVRTTGNEDYMTAGFYQSSWENSSFVEL